MDTKKFLITIFLFGIGVRCLLLGVGFTAGGSDFIFNYGDAVGYGIIAKNLVEGNGFSLEKEPPFLPNGNRTPGYPVFLAAVYAFGGNFYPAVLIQILLGAVIPILGYKILKELDFSELVSRIAGILLAAEPFLAAHSAFLLTEVLFIFLFLTALVLYIYRWKNGRPLVIFAATAFLLGLAALVRPVGLYVIPIFGTFVLFMEYGPLRKRAFAGTMVLLVGFITVFPWLWRNYNQFGVMRLTYIDAKNIYYNYAGGTLAMANGATLDVEQKKLTALIREAGLNSQSPALPDFFRQEAKKIIFAHPFAFLKLNALTAWQFFTHDAYYDLAVHLGFYRGSIGPPISILDFRRSLAAIPGLFLRDPFFFVFIAGRIFWITVMFFFFGGVWSSLRDRGNRRRDLLILVLIGYFLAASLTTGYAINARLRLPILPFYLAYAAVGAMAMYSRIFIKKSDEPISLPG